MFTLFSTPKAFRGEFARIQRNALRSWVALRPRPEILILGDEEGTAEACAEFGVRHIPALPTSKSGAPVLPEVFQIAERAARWELLCLVNADVILTQDLITAVRTVDPKSRGALMVLTPADLPVEFDLQTERPGWDDDLHAGARLAAAPPSPYGADVFLFPKGYFHSAPPLLMGRAWWDTWLIAQGCFDLSGVDATPFCFTIHQRHRQSTHTGDFEWANDETTFNERFIRWYHRDCRRTRLPYELTPEGRLRRRYFRTWLGTRGAITPKLLAVSLGTATSRIFRKMRLVGG